MYLAFIHLDHKQSIVIKIHSHLILAAEFRFVNLRSSIPPSILGLHIVSHETL